MSLKRMRQEGGALCSTALFCYPAIPEQPFNFYKNALQML